MRKTYFHNSKSVKNEINWALPDQTVSSEEFRAEISEAEKGPFINQDEFGQRFKEWKLRKGLTFSGSLHTH
jgi:hypothetical protein